jgi:predicted TIM-barrel fold metal-dependent hydrolase
VEAPVDHHVHLLSPGLVADWKGLGVPFGRPDEEYGSLAPLEGFGARVLSMAYLYGSEWFREGLALGEAEELARVRRENDFVAGVVRGRAELEGFGSADPLRPYALEELRRCREELGLAGVKLHLAMAGVDLREAAHLDALAEVAAWAERSRTPLVLHLDTQRRGTEVAHVEAFVARVLDPHPRLELTIAHLGGSGGYGAWTRAVLGVFLERIERDPGFAARPIAFDLSAVVLESPSVGIPATTEEELTLLRLDLRRLGLERVRFGSDHPVFEPAATWTVLRERVGLSEVELARIAGGAQRR